MPCYDSSSRVSQSLVDEKNKDIEKLENRNAILSSMLCAILNELDNRGITESVTVNASRHGLIDIAGFWATHKADDKARLSADFHKRYSVDEQRLIIKMMGEMK